MLKVLLKLYSDFVFLSLVELIFNVARADVRVYMCVTLFDYVNAHYQCLSEEVPAPTTNSVSC